MPEGRYAGVVILAEDAKQARFTRSWLKEHVNVDHRNVRDVISPKGRGAAEQFVRNRFAAEVNSHRRNASKRGSMLITVIDADATPFEERYKELLNSIEARDGVFVFVPKRNIETWLRALNSFQADESTDFKRTEHGSERDAGKILLTLIRSPQVHNLLPSLEFGLKEARTMPKHHVA